MKLKQSIRKPERPMNQVCSPGFSRYESVNFNLPRAVREQDRLKPGLQTRAFTLIEIMVVVVILGILAATIIPQFIGTTHDAKVSAAKATVAELESALERFNIHLDPHPTTEEGLKVLVEPPTGDDKQWR